MPAFATTNLQLFKQLLAQNYTHEDLTRVLRTYEWARLLFSGQYIYSGKTQLAHSVGTASILAYFHAPPRLVAAGLIHNVYGNGDFGDGAQGISAQRRNLLRRMLGREIEQAAADFATLRWNEKNLANFLLGKDPLTRDLVFLRLADILDHQQDGGLHYDQKFRLIRKGSKVITPLIIQAANALGLPKFAEELERAKRQNESPQHFEELHQKYGHKKSFVLVPSSYSQKVLVRLFSVFSRCRRNGGQHGN